MLHYFCKNSLNLKEKIFFFIAEFDNIFKHIVFDKLD